MPCALTTGYSLDCKDSAGGITEVYFIEKGNVSSIAANASGVVTGITKASGKRFWKYELPKETGNFTHNPQVSTENGTLFFEQNLTIVVNKLSASVNTELKLLAQNILIAVVKDNNNKFWMLGKERGLDMAASESGSGTAFGDRSGYTLNFMGKEPDLLYEVNSSVAAALETAG
jgi:hypothetical protein